MPRVDLKLKQLFIDLSIDEDYLSVSECSFFYFNPAVLPSWHLHLSIWSPLKLTENQ